MRFPVTPRLQSGNLPRRYSKAAGSRPIAFRGSKRFETDCALNRLPSRLCVTTLPKKRHFSVDSYGEKCVFNARSEAGKTLLIVREDQGATASASPEESNEKRRFYLPIELCLQSEHPVKTRCSLRRADCLFPICDVVDWKTD